MTKTTLWTFGITSLLACNLSGKIDAAIDKLDIFCTPGEEIECSCEDGEEGSQTCQPQGTSFSDCQCENSSAVSECTPGEMDACVCEGTEDIGTRTCLDNKEWDDCFCETSMTTTEEDPTESNDIPQTTWVLRDKNGEALSAVFEPYCPKESALPCIYLQDIRTYPCVYIKYYNENFVDMAYDLKTGDPRKCYPDYPDKKSSWSFCVYPSQDCTVTPLCAQDSILFQDPGKKFQINKKMYGVDLPKKGQEFDQLFMYQESDHSCNFVEESWYSSELYQPYLVADEVAYAFIDKAPYTISLE